MRLPLIRGGSQAADDFSLIADKSINAIRVPTFKMRFKFCCKLFIIKNLCVL